MKQKQCIVTAAVFGSALLVGGAGFANDKPNVVIMLADNVGWGDISAYSGGPKVRGMPTTNIDALAAEGMQLTQFFVEPGCTPSRAALMTGRYSNRSGLGTIIIGGTPNTLKDEEITLAEVMQDAGYKTAMYGKWHLGSEEQSWPTRQGFDYYGVGVIETSDGTLYRQSMERHGISEDVIAARAPKIMESDSDGTLHVVREYDLAYRAQVEGDIAKGAVEYIQENADSEDPFFLYIGWTNTHYPNSVAPEFSGITGYPYGDAITELDARTGEVLDAIDDAGIADNTIVMWLSDNGATPSAAPYQHKGGSNGPFRGELGDALEGSLRVPAMVRWPGHIAPSVSNEMVSVHDIMPTIAALTGAAMPTDRYYDGFDQSALLKGDQQNSNREALITWVNNEIGSIRWRNYRVYPKAFATSFYNNPSQGGGNGIQLKKNELPDIYDIEMDPREEINITADHAWVLGYTSQVLAEYYATLKDDPNPPGVSLTILD
ncbi:arylsulfatase [Shimia abyssi]|uniref:Arylsulfatase n=1 Tax=Shimia abyssi TaxID=1662395 RepID=A0A2P8FEB3_9RHOB|nr:arylsulfatase [Shimia abyssi]PSL20066.1 arylsulfatase [Shimia abyssi]